MTDTSVDVPEFDFEQLMAAMRMPETPADALSEAPSLRAAVQELNVFETLEALGGLATDPRFQGNAVRLDWATRLVAALAHGRRAPTRNALSALLNRQLTEARVNRLEDPVEDFFVERLLTPQGDFLIFPGLWEKAAAHTESLIRAFAALPDDPQKALPLEMVYALLKLSDALVKRAGLEEQTIGMSEPWSPIAVPKAPHLRTLAERVRFSWDELAALEIEPGSLGLFTLDQATAPTIIDVVGGDSVLEAQPLIATPDGIIVVSPANISTAVRSLLIDVAVNGGMAKALQKRLFDIQSQRVTEGSFLRLYGPAYSHSGLIIRQYATELSTGRHLHVLQGTEGFDGWPNTRFGTMSSNDALCEMVAKDIAHVRQECMSKPGFRQGITFLILGGWGNGCAFEFDRPPDWPVVFLEPSDAAVLGFCDDASPADIWRLHRQVGFVAEQGFQLEGANGIVNLFEWWRKTDWSLVPPHMVDLVPPMQVHYDTDLLLGARKESALKAGRRTIPHPRGGQRFAVRMQREVVAGPLEPIYSVLPTATERRLSGAVVHDNVAWWVEHGAAPAGHGMAVFETWKAALKWLHLVMPAFLEAFDLREARLPSLLIELDVQALDDESFGDLTEADIWATLHTEIDTSTRTARLRIEALWHRGLHRSDNLAEALLATKMLEALAVLSGVETSPETIRDLVVKTAQTPDTRWRHMLKAHNAVDHLSALGLIEKFRPTPQSAGGLVKCGAAWAVRDRSEGGVITGKAECAAFLKDHAAHLLKTLRNGAQMFDRRNLIVASLRAVQGAQAEQRGWAVSARALRAIHGIEGDFDASFRTASEINAVIRGSSLLVELAMAESPTDGGLAVGRMDQEEMRAHAVLTWDVGDSLAAIHGDAIKPLIHISPTGDVLYEHEFEEKTLKESAKLRHAREREQESQRYLDRFETKESEPRDVEDLQVAVRAEYGDFDAFMDLAFALAVVAEHAGQQDVFVMRRSELLSELDKTDLGGDRAWSEVVDRLTMRPREGWEDIPNGASATDFDLAKFDRRLSVIGRPLVALTSDEDAELVVAPGMVERAIYHNLAGAMNGSLQNAFWRSREMQVYASRQGASSGLEFNDRVAEQTRRLGLTAWASSKPSWCLNQKATPELKRLGDVDVLAVGPGGTVVWVIEAKDLKLCRTRGETARRLAEYRGRHLADGKPDKMLRHLARVEYLRQHAADLAHRLKLAATPRVCGLVAVHSPQPMQFLPSSDSEDGKVVMLGGLEAVPWATGW